MDDRAVLLYLLLFFAAFAVWCAFCASLLALTRGLGAVARLAARAVVRARFWAVALALAVVAATSTTRTAHRREVSG